MSFESRMAAVAWRKVVVPDGAVQFRDAGEGGAISHVMLHGIGSGADSWVRNLAAVVGRAEARVLAWNAPGYGQSTPLTESAPTAGHYAERLWASLDALSATQPVVLVGHSLGAMMAAAAAARQPQRVSRLVLLAPARGYGHTSPTARAERLQQRLAGLQQGGAPGLAQRRAPHMLSPQAPPAMVSWVRQIMAQLRPEGYAQAARLLVGGDLLRDLALVACPVVVASGEADTITPPAACQAVACAAGVSWQSLGPVGHVCGLEAAAEVNTLLDLPPPADIEDFSL